MDGRRYHNVYEDGGVLFWTSSIVEWLPVFRSPKAADLFVCLLDEYRRRYQTRLYAYCLMPEHIHLITQCPTGPKAQTFHEQLLRSFSARIAARCEKAALAGNETAARWMNSFRANARGRSRVRVWKERGRAVPLVGRQQVLDKVVYIHNNPVRRGLCEAPEDYAYSSAAWYAGGSGPISLDPVDW